MLIWFSSWRCSGGASINTDEHKKPRINIWESGMVEGGRTAANSNLGDEKESPQGRAPRHADKHDHLHIIITRPRREGYCPHEKCSQSAHQLGPLWRRSNHLCSPIVISWLVYYFHNLAISVGTPLCAVMSPSLQSDHHHLHLQLVYPTADIRKIKILLKLT